VVGYIVVLTLRIHGARTARTAHTPRAARIFTPHHTRLLRTLHAHRHATRTRYRCAARTPRAHTLPLCLRTIRYTTQRAHALRAASLRTLPTTRLTAAAYLPAPAIHTTHRNLPCLHTAALRTLPAHPASGSLVRSHLPAARRAARFSRYTRCCSTCTHPPTPHRSRSIRMFAPPYHALCDSQLPHLARFWLGGCHGRHTTPHTCCTHAHHAPHTHAHLHHAHTHTRMPAAPLPPPHAHHACPGGKKPPAISALRLHTACPAHHCHTACITLTTTHLPSPTLAFHTPATLHTHAFTHHHAHTRTAYTLYLHTHTHHTHT